MRTNLPVTNVEYPLKEGTCIVSRTDLKGRITYVNQDFLEYSGFTEDELIGKAHNIVRHPDMPPERFRTFGTRSKLGARGPGSSRIGVRTVSITGWWPTRRR